MLIKILGGFLMALADSVPGVSGGTVAFIIGIYDEFINSLNNIVSKDKEKRIAAVKFLITMGCGWVFGMALAAIVIKAVFEKNIYEISSLFLGFVLAAIPIIIMEEKKAFAGKLKNIIYFVFGAALVCIITYLSGHIIGDGLSLAFGEYSVVTAILLFLCGVCAISAMVLPGISGSTIMLVFGFYQAIMTAIAGILHFELKYFLGLCIFALGCITGICTSVKGLKYLLEKHRSAIMYAIIGMMTGSFYAIAMGPTSISKENDALSFSSFHPVYFIVGVIVIFGIQALKKVFNRHA